MISVKDLSQAGDNILLIHQAVAGIPSNRQQGAFHVLLWGNYRYSSNRRGRRACQ